MGRIRRAVIASILLTVPLSLTLVLLEAARNLLAFPWPVLAAVFAAVIEFGLVASAVALGKAERTASRYRLLGELSAEVNRAVLLNTDEAEVFSTILDYSFRILNSATLGSVLVLDEGYLVVAASRGLEEDYARTFRIRLEDTWQHKQARGRLTDALIATAQTLREADALVDNWSRHHRSVISTPLFVEGRLYGLLNVDSLKARSFRHEDLEVMRWFRAQIEVCLLARELFSKALAESRVDGLTKFLSRSAFDERFQQTVEHCNRYGEVFTLGMFDVDGLKSVNDNFGHGAGDHLLRSVCEVLKQTARKTDLVGRYGGDEFVALYHNTDAQTMTERAAGLSEHLKSRPPEFHGQTIPASFSYGFADFPGDGKSFQDLVAVADHRLYQTKSLRSRR
jgi:diguanylate cyclase (GGDEF)-like protein